MRSRLIDSFTQGYYWLAERLYNELAWAYDPVSWLVSLGQWDVWRKGALDYLTGKRILEIGFGTGELRSYSVDQVMRCWSDSTNSRM